MSEPTSFPDVLAARLAVLVVVASAVTPGALSAHTTLTGSMDGPGWVLFDYVGAPGSLYLSVQSTFHGPGWLSIEWRPAGRSGYTAGGGASFPGTEASVGPESARAPLLPFTLTRDIAFNGGLDARIAIWSQSESDPWSWSATLPHGATLTLIDSRLGGLFYNGDETSSGFHAHASAQYATVSSSVLAKYEFSIENGFLGVAGDHPSPRDEVDVTKPDGSVQRCPCHLPYGPVEWGPGDYEIAWRGTTVSTSQTLLLAGVDIPGLPPSLVPPAS